MREIAAKCEEHHLHALPTDHPVFNYIDGILHTIAIMPQGVRMRETVSNHAASVICNAMYASEEQNEIEVESLGLLLRKLCELSPNTAKEVVMWLSRDKEDDRVFNVLTTITLVRSQLLSVQQLDETMSRKINARNPLAVEFLARLL